MKKEFRKFYKKAKEIYRNEPTGHDFSHIKRCLRTAKKIQKREGGDDFVLTLSILFHDVHRVLSTKEKYCTAQESIPYIRKCLKEFDIENEDLEKILYYIERHDDKDENKNYPIELIILQDADILDAVGKIGLKRTKTYCINRGIPFYDPNFPLDDPSYIPNLNPLSTTHYVYRTMLPEFNLIKTQTGKKLAHKQERVLKKFVEQNTKQKLSYEKKQAK